MSKWIDRTFGVAFGASVLLHAGGVGGPAVYEWWTGRPAGFFFTPPAQQPVKKIPVEFVDSPDAAPDEAAPERETRRISDKQTSARDLTADTAPATAVGPSAPVKEGAQLAKKTQPDRVVRLEQGTPEKPQEFMTAEDPLKKEETSAEPAKELEDLKTRVRELEEMKTLLEEMREKKQIAEREKQEILKEQVKKKLEELKQKREKQGNAPQSVQEAIFNPARNLDTHNAEQVQKFLATAVNVGEAAFDAKKHVLGPYLKKLKSRISPMWRLKLESETFGNILTEKKVTIGFKILSDGRLAEILILEDYGDDLFNRVCVDTIRAAAPFEPLPAAWLEQSKLDYLNLIYSFVVY